MATALASGTTTSLVLLDPLERRVIMYLRLLHSGQRGRAEVEQDLSARAGHGAEQALTLLESLESSIRRAVGRQFDISSVDSVRATTDEMIFARLIAAAADIRPEDCQLQASRVAGSAGAAPLAKAAEAAAAAIATGEFARCSCGRTSIDPAVAGSLGRRG